MTATVLKTEKNRLLLSAGAILACLMLPHAAHAQMYNNHSHGNTHQIVTQQVRHDNGNHNGWDNHRDNRVVVNVVRPQRQVVYYYPQQYYRPAPVVVYNQPVRYVQVQPRYYVGDRLINCEPVPQDILYNLRPAPRGYYYGMQGRNVYLLRQNDNVIAQIFDALLGGTL